MQARKPASSEKGRTERQSSSWWAAPRRLNGVLKKQGLSTAGAAQFGYRRGICWRSFKLPDVLWIIMLELKAQRKLAFAAAGSKEAKVTHLDEAFR